MRLSVTVLGLLVQLVAVVLSCDPLTQYERNDGQCCKKCGPGTRMSSDNLSCLDPQCTSCADNEYQESYTKDIRCKTHPYCDPNKNFIFTDIADKSKTSQSPCTCETGYHCSSEECINCVPHTTCKAGYRVQSKGDPIRDTVCQECPTGTFSTGDAEASDCTKWTVCGDGFQIQINGTATSDIICAEKTKEPQRGYKGTLIILSICLLLLALFGITFCKLRGNSGEVRGNLKGCMELCLSKKEGMAPDTVVQPHDDHEVVTETVLSLEEHPSLLPEENELKDDQNQPGAPLLPGVTYNGNVVAQEDGKREALSRQESQTNSV